MGEREETGGGGGRPKDVIGYAAGAENNSAVGGLSVGSVICGIAAVAALGVLVVAKCSVPSVWFSWRWVFFMLVAAAGAGAVILGGVECNRGLSRAGRLGMGRTGAVLGLLAVVGVVVLMSWPPTYGIGGGRLACPANLRQIGVGLTLYAEEHGGVLPMRFDQLMTETGLSPDVFICPSSKDQKAAGPTTRAMIEDFNRAGRCSYVYRAGGLRLKDLPRTFILAHDRPENHDGVGMNVLYGDGHVDWIAGPEAKRVISELDAGHNPPRARQ